jgi:Ca2+-binding EF-hand superfamily protein
MDYPFEMRDFLKMIAKKREKQLRHVKEAVQPSYPCGSHSDKVPVTEVRQVLTSSGYSPHDAIWESFLSEIGGETKEVDFWELDSVITRFRRAVRDRLQAVHGITDQEYAALQELFSKYDPKSSGYLPHSALRSILEISFPHIWTSQEEHQVVQSILQEVGKKRSGQLDFQEFLKFMRTIYLHTQKAKMVAGRETFKKERNAIKASRFNFLEVKEFRHIFENRADPVSGGISAATFEDMIQQLLAPRKTGKSAADQLSSRVKSLMKSVSKDLEHNWDFPDFLAVMRKVGFFFKS